MFATFVIFKKLLKVKCHPMGENSPNLDTLLPLQDENPFRTSFQRNASQNTQACGFTTTAWSQCYKSVLALLISTQSLFRQYFTVGAQWFIYP
jgi:hypothetical protein